MAARDKRKWFRLDNAGKLYPAIATSKWSSIFRVSALLTKPIVPELLQRAVDRVLPRFPSMAVRMRRGVFWYYLEENKRPFVIRQDTGHPCMRFRWNEEGGYLLRVLYYQKRISVEVFHSLTDGMGGFIFLKTLVAEYLRQCGVRIPAGEGVLDLKTKPTVSELEDAFLRAPLPTYTPKRKENPAYHLPSQKEPPHTLHVIAATMPLAKVRERSLALGVTITEFQAACLLYACYLILLENGGKGAAPIRISIPVNLRKYFATDTLRNFSSYVNVEIDPRLGQYTFEEIARAVHAYMQYAVDKKKLFGGVATNVAEERKLFLRLAPLPLKNFAINSVFRYYGDRVMTTTLTSMGRISAPEQMLLHVERFELMLGASAKPSCNCALTTTGETMLLMFTRNVRDAALERTMLRFLVEQGIPVTVESNGG